MRSAGAVPLAAVLLPAVLSLAGCGDRAAEERPVQGAEAPSHAVEVRGGDTGATVVNPLSAVDPPRALVVDESFDLSGDGAPERVLLYVDAERDRAGRLQWDDGQRWALHVLAGGATYPLFDDYVQIGRLRFWVIEPGDAGAGAGIVLLRETGAGLEMRSYRFEPGRGFVGTVEYTTSGNVIFTSPEIR